MRFYRRSIIVFCAILIFISLLIYIMFPRANPMNYIPFESQSSPQVVGSDERIPRIIHQCYRNTQVPMQWNETHQSIIDRHPDYRHVLWTVITMRAFIAANYSWFLPEFDSYPYWTQRVDAFRYFILYHYGGLYIDLDIGARRPFDLLLKYDAVIAKTKPIGFATDFMATRPRHRFFLRLINSLRYWNHYYILPYATVMFSTGPVYLSIQYHLADNDQISDIRVMNANLYTNSDGLTRHVKGNSWHSWDAPYIFWMQRNIGKTVLAALFAISLVIYQGFRFVAIFL